MIGLAALMLVQAVPAVTAAAPAPAERWELDQVRFPPPADPAKLKASLLATKSMSNVVDLLTAQGIRFERTRVTIDPATVPADVRATVLALPPGEPFVSETPQLTTINVLVARRPAAAPAPVDPQLAAAAEELLREMHSEDQMRAVVQQSITQMRSGATINAQVERNDAMRMQRAKNPQAWDAAAQQIGGLQAAAMERVIADLSPELHRQSIAAYTTNFTLAEIRQLIAFYRSPIGRKLIDRGPAISGATALWFQRAFAERLAPAMAALQPQIQQIMAPLLPSPPAR